MTPEQIDAWRSLLDAFLNDNPDELSHNLQSICEQLVALSKKCGLHNQLQAIEMTNIIETELPKLCDRVLNKTLSTSDFICIIVDTILSLQQNQ